MMSYIKDMIKIIMKACLINIIQSSTDILPEKYTKRK